MPVSHPIPPPDSFLWFYLHRNLLRDPHWDFQTHLLGYGLRCERLNFHNYEDVVIELGSGTPGPYVDHRFLSYEKMYEYVMHLLAVLPYSAKRGGTDYIIIDTPGKNMEYKTLRNPHALDYSMINEGQQLCGLLHLFDLSKERFGHGMPNPVVGITLSESARGKGIATRAMDMLERYVFETYGEAGQVVAMIDKENERSLRFFRKRGYHDVSDKYDPGTDFFFAKDRPQKDD